MKNQTSIAAVTSRMEGPFILSNRAKVQLQRRADLRQQRDQGEVCGVLLADSARYLKLIFLKNLSPTPGRFQLSRHEVAYVRHRARLSRTPMIGYFHSHPISSPVPSEG